MSQNLFETLSLSPEVLQAVGEMNYNEMTPIQAAAIPLILDGQDIVGRSSTGTGKTAAFGLPAVERCGRVLPNRPQVLVLAPTRELALQISGEMRKYAKFKPSVRIATIYGGDSITAQMGLLRTANLVVGTPGRVMDHMRRETLLLDQLEMVVLDEASSFKHHSTQRFKALRRMRPHIKRVVELTGTPAPKDYLDLWAQVYLLDEGQRLGQRFTQYRDNYFQPDKRNGMQVYSWKPRKGAEEAIQTHIADIAISIQAADHLHLPEKILEDIPVVFPAPDWKVYQEMQTAKLLEVDSETITAMQAATLTGKLLQLCNGAMYDAEKQVHPLNRCKLDAFGELIDALDGQKALVFYGFDFDKDFLQAELKTREKGLRFAVLKGREEADAWNRGELDVLLAQPASCAYGLNLQAGGHHLIWYSLPWNLELYEQGNARLYRQGQQHPVIIHRLLVKGGADELVAKALESKSACQQGLIQGIKALAEEAHHAAAR